MAPHYETHRFYPKLLLTRALVGLPLLYPVIVMPCGPALLAGIAMFGLIHATDTLFQQLIDRDIVLVRQAKAAAQRKAEAEQLARRHQRMLEAHQAALERAAAEAEDQAAAVGTLPEESPAH